MCIYKDIKEEIVVYICLSIHMDEKNIEFDYMSHILEISRIELFEYIKELESRNFFDHIEYKDDSIEYLIPNEIKFLQELSSF